MLGLRQCHVIPKSPDVSQAYRRAHLLVHQSWLPVAPESSLTISPSPAGLLEPHHRHRYRHVLRRAAANHLCNHQFLFQGAPVLGERVEALDADPARSSTTLGSLAGPTTRTESVLGEVLAEVVGLDRVPVDANFFDDLGADSMVMARFCARARKRTDLPSISMKDVY